MSELQFFTHPQTTRSLRRTNRLLKRTNRLLARNVRLYWDVVPAPIIGDAVKLLRDDNLIWKDLEHVRKPLADLIEAIAVYPVLRPQLMVFCEALFAAPTDSLIDDLGL